MNKDMKIIGAITLGAVILLTGIMLASPASPTAPTSLEPIAVDEGKLIRDDSRTIPAFGSKVTMVEFGDYQCPACASVAWGIEQILEEYKGKITFVWRHYPLPMHANATAAALAAEAAGEQGKYWEMHHQLFARQKDWSSSSEANTLFEGYATELGLDLEKFKTSLANDVLLDRIRRDKGDALALQINATPTIFINGVKLGSSASYDNLKAIIEAELAK